jgi:hypothetical protein
MTISLTLPQLEYRGGSALAAVLLCATLTFAQSDPSYIQPLRTTPTEKLTVNPGFRDWGPTMIAGTTILDGNPTRPDWPFGHVTPVNGGLWADSYQALVKLR